MDKQEVQDFYFDCSRMRATLSKAACDKNREKRKECLRCPTWEVDQEKGRVDSQQVMSQVGENTGPDMDESLRRKHQRVFSYSKSNK